MNNTHSTNRGDHGDSLFYKRKVRKIWRIAASAIIVIWTAWTLLDAFVIPRDIIHASELSGSDYSAAAITSDGEPVVQADPKDGEEALTEPVITDSSYEDGHISIRISTMRRLDTDIYIADITVDDPDCLRTALAGNAFARNLTDTTSSIAREHGAILAINGDYYGFRDAGYVMRNGYLYRELAAYDQN